MNDICPSILTILWLQQCLKVIDFDESLYGCFVLTYEPQVIPVLCSQNIDDNDSPDEIPLCKHKYIYTYLLSFK